MSGRIIHGDSRGILPALRGKVDLIVTSPPYADARKNHYDSIHPDHFAEWFLTFHEPMLAALNPNGSLILNIKDKVVDGARHRYVWDTIQAFSERGWYAIDDYIWHKPNPMPGFWPSRLRDGWEYCFHLSPTRRPYINFDAVRRPIGDWSRSRLASLGANDTKRHNSANRSGFGRDISRWVHRDKVLPPNVLTIPLVGKNKGHPAVFPVELPTFFIKLLCPENGLVVDPFGGSGTTAVAACNENRDFVIIDNNKEYCEQMSLRLKSECSLELPIHNVHTFQTSFFVTSGGRGKRRLAA